MIIKSALATSASGSIGGLTANRGRGRIILGRKAHPTNPNTPLQQHRRQIMGAVMNQWAAELTDAQRAAWALYADNVLVPDALGTPIKTSGANMFLRTNSLAAIAGQPTYLDAPATFSLAAPITGISFAPDGADDLSVLWDHTTHETSTTLLFASRPQAPTIGFNRAGYQFAGQAGTGAGNVAYTYAQGPAVTGQQVFFRLVNIESDGRVSMDSLARTILP